MVPVDTDVQLEVLAWGGSGRALVLLAGAGNTGHVFEEFAPRLANVGRVYAITRRGYGSSSAPAEGYTVDRLGTASVCSTRSNSNGPCSSVIRLRGRS